MLPGQVPVGVIGESIIYAGSELLKQGHLKWELSNDKKKRVV